jgi:hypothetical protein
VNNHKNTVRDGEKSEQMFSTKCFVEMGYMVSRPIGTSDYDCVVDVKGKLLKVQVKSSRRQCAGGGRNVMICKGTNAVKSGKQGKYPYPENSVDFFAIHDVNNDEWYIISRSATGDAKQIRLSKGEGKYSNFKDNWEFKEECNFK